MDAPADQAAEESTSPGAARPAHTGEDGCTDEGTDRRAASRIAGRADAAAQGAGRGVDETTGRLADQLLTLSRWLHRSQRRLMEPLGITPAQARLLRALAHCEAPPRMADLARLLDVVPRAVTTLVDALEERELVRRVPDPHNRRVIRIELREDGAQALSALRGVRRAAAAELLAPLDETQRAALSALLDTLGEGQPAAHKGHRGHRE